MVTKISRVLIVVGFFVVAFLTMQALLPTYFGNETRVNGNISNEVENTAKEDFPVVEPAEEPPYETGHAMPYPEPAEDQVACTMDAKMCPDGSFVGRTGPNCEFSACTSELDSEGISCTDEMKNATSCDDVYQPVCGLVEVQCIKAPCPPIPENFSNACNACAQGNVSSYVEGTCQLQVN